MEKNIEEIRGCLRGIEREENISSECSRRNNYIIACAIEIKEVAQRIVDREISNIGLMKDNEKVKTIMEMFKLYKEEPWVTATAMYCAPYIIEALRNDNGTLPSNVKVLQGRMEKILKVASEMYRHGWSDGYREGCEEEAKDRDIE